MTNSWFLELFKSGLFRSGYAAGFGIGAAVTIVSMVPKPNIAPWFGVGVAVVIAGIGFAHARKLIDKPEP